MAEHFIHKQLRFFVALALCIIVILSGFFIADRIDPNSGLSKRRGGAERYLSSETGISCSLQSSGKDAWGFLEWPEKGLYGFFSGSEEGREIRAFVESAGASPLMILSRNGVSDSLNLRFSGGHGLEGNFRLIRQKNLGLGLKTFSGKLDSNAKALSPLREIFQPPSVQGGRGETGASFFHISAIEALSRPDKDRLNLSLRRGMTSLAYARDQWEAFRERRVSLSAASPWPIEFIERDCLVASGPSVISIASERYAFDGGAHGNTSLVVRMIDAASGRILGPEDIFLEGWEAKLAALLEAEALRLFAGTGSRGEKAKGLGLKQFGFFEERIEPSRDIFICESGVGFHYDRYRLAPYSEGDFTFVIPWKELAGLLKPF